MKDATVFMFVLGCGVGIGLAWGVTLGQAFDAYCSRQVKRTLDWIERKAGVQPK